MCQSKHLFLECKTIFYYLQLRQFKSKEPLLKNTHLTDATVVSRFVLGPSMPNQLFSSSYKCLPQRLTLLQCPQQTIPEEAEQTLFNTSINLLEISVTLNFILLTSQRTTIINVVKQTHLIISKSLWSDTFMFLAMFQER